MIPQYLPPTYPSRACDVALLAIQLTFEAHGLELSVFLSGDDKYSSLRGPSAKTFVRRWISSE